MNSIWTKDYRIKAFPRLEGDLNTDVLIIGGGLAGILCAHALKRDGVDYTLIEADRIGSGITCNTTAKITSQHGLLYGKLLKEFGPDRARRYWELNQEAIEAFRELSRSVPCDFEEKDSYVFSVDSPEKLETEMDALKRLEIPAEYVQRTPLPFPVAGAIRFPDQAQFHPLKLLSGLVNGMRIYENTGALAFEGNTVLTERGKITASKIIVATHFPILNKHGSYFLKMYQQRSYVLALENATQVDGMYLDAAENGISLRNFGELLLVGGGGHRTGKQGGGWAELEAFGKKHWPQAREVCRWATQDCMTLDGIPYIGQYSASTPGLYVATGFNKWGMTSSVTAAKILGDLARGRENRDASIFSPSRSILRRQLLVNAFESTVNLLTPTKPRCPHLGCALKWNPQERSWDCPCHGSRFSKNGKLLDGPANGDLKRKNG